MGPLLLLLLLGMVEIGRMMMVQQILTNGAREGARLAVLPGATKTAAEQVVTDYLRDNRIEGCSVELSDPATASPGDPITVSVSVSTERTAWLPVPLLRWLGGKVQQATSVMRKEGKTY